MKQLNLAEAKAKLSHLVDQAARGKGVIIAKPGIRALGLRLNVAV